MIKAGLDNFHYMQLVVEVRVKEYTKVSGSRLHIGGQMTTVIYNLGSSKANKTTSLRWRKGSEFQHLMATRHV
jgi:hypothetical protein